MSGRPRGCPAARAAGRCAYTSRYCPLLTVVKWKMGLSTRLITSGQCTMPGRHEDHGGPVDDVLLVLQPDLHLAVEVVGILRVAAEEADDLVAVVDVGLVFERRARP